MIHWPPDDVKRKWLTPTNDVRVYKRGEYAGNIFLTSDYGSVKADDSNFRYDFLEEDENQTRTSSFASIQKMFTHELYHGGPSRIVLQGKYLQVDGVSPKSGLTIVKKVEHHRFNIYAKYSFLHTCYQQPVAIWPAALSGSRKWVVIDCNEEEEE